MFSLPLGGLVCCRMSAPLVFTRSLHLSDGASLGAGIADQLQQSPHVQTLLDCLCSTHEPAIFSSDLSLPPLLHEDIHSFVRSFALPHSSSRSPLGPNDRVMIALPTGPINALALLAIATYHTCAPINASCTAAELKEDATRIRIKAIVTTEDSVQRLELRQLRDAVGCDVILLHDRDSGPPGLFDMVVLDESHTDLAYQPPRTPSVPHGLGDLSLILHTSGTSGKKKVVPYTLRSLLIGTMAVIISWDLRSSDMNMNMMPLFHVGGIVRNLLAPIMSGGSAIMCPGFDAMMFWDLAFKLKFTWYYAAPTIHHTILESQPEEITPSHDLRIRMICNAAGGLLPSLAAQLKERFKDAVVLPSYGMTECMPIASPPTTYQLERPGCSGIACGPQLSIRDPNNIENELPLGKTGAVCVRGYPTFCGYEVDPDPNVPLDVSAFSTEGWFDSGDCGHMDFDGYLYITGRSKEIINKGGEVISPFEIEEAIMTAAKGHVKATLAFSIAHDVLQEAIGVVIVPEPGRPRIGLSQLQDLLADHLHPSKWPFIVVYMGDLPKNSAGKPLRINLATRFGLECFTENTPLLDRHFEAVVPSPQAPLSQPISCTLVSVDLVAIEHELLSLKGVAEVAVRSLSDGTPEAFLFVDCSGLSDAETINHSLLDSLPGYCLPKIHLSHSPLVKNPNGTFAFDHMEYASLSRHHAEMTSQEISVRDIVAELLSLDARMINRQSDFFLLGGNSLLLGKLSHLVRKKTGVTIPIASIFTNRTVAGIASLIEVEWSPDSPIEEKTVVTNATNSGTDLTQSVFTLDVGEVGGARGRNRGQFHPLVLLIQSIPMIFFVPLKSALRWTLMIYIIARLSALFLDGHFYERMAALLFAILMARLASQFLAPLGAIVFKWTVIGKYRPGTYRMWSGYYLRWWIVNQSILLAGKGIFAMHPLLQTLYYRLLGAKIGRNVSIDKHAQLGEFDLLCFGDGCRIDSATIRGFCVEREGTFRLEPIKIGREAVINTYTSISPGSIIPDNSTWGPHSSSLEEPHSASYASYNRTFLREPNMTLKILVGWPIIFLVTFISYLPWFVVVWLIISQTDARRDDSNALLSVIYWFASPDRIAFHIVGRIIRQTLIPIIKVGLGIGVKRILGLNKPCVAEDASQMSLLRRFINSKLLSKNNLKDVFEIVGTHYEAVSFTYRLMGAKVGRRVYWPGSGIDCLDPELLEIGDDVVFGSRSQIFTTDKLGTDRITIGNGAMIADRVVLLPGTSVGHRAVMGSGALSRRNTFYEDNSVWMGNHRGEAICFNKGSPDKGEDTITPFGRAFYNRQADYFVYPYFLVVLVNFGVTSCHAAFWTLAGVSAAQILQQLQLHLPQVGLFQPDEWYTFGILYGLIAVIFLVVLNIQVVITLMWAIVAKWIVIGRRYPGPYHWDKSSYCQRWQLHLTLSRPLYRGYSSHGCLAPINGTGFIVWFYRALGAKIGQDCAVFPSGKSGLITEPDLVELGDNVSIDFCSVVAHLNSRGNFELNALKVGSGCALRSGSRLLSGASMEDNSMLCEHTCLTSGEVAESGEVYVGWPARRVERRFKKGSGSVIND